MVTITAITPGFPLTDLPVGLLLNSVDGYVACYARTRDALYSRTDLQVVVTDPVSARWFKVMARHYGAERIVFKELTLRSFLEERIGMPIPADFNETDLRESGLAELNIPSTNQASFGDYLLEVFFGSFLNKADMVYRINEILAAYEPEQWQQALTRPLIGKMYRERLHCLHSEMDPARQLADLQLLAWFEKSPEVYIRYLSALKLLQNYPELMGISVLGNVYADLIQLNLDLRRVPIILHGNEPTLDEIRIYLQNAAGQADPTTVDQLLEQVSGLLEIELETIIAILKSGRVEVTKTVIQRVRRKFTPLQNQPEIAQELADLGLLVAVPVPSEPQPEWDVQEWIRWAVEEYLPYRFWLESLGELNDGIGELAGKYADWLYSNYGWLLFNSPRMAWRAVFDLKDKMRAHSGPVLMVMVDNLNPKFYPLLQNQLHQQGFYEQDFNYCVSMLPSFTEVGKKCVLTGHFEPFEGSSYAQIVEQTWASRLNKQVRYLPNILELRKIAERTHEVFILNYLPVDLCLHQHESHIGISHSQTIQVYMTALAQDIRSFARRIGAERDLMVIIASDHGSTRIPRGTVNVIEDKLYKKHAMDEHHRFISVNDAEAQRLSEKVQYDCYLFRRKEHGLPNNYLVARRLYRFLPTDDSVYIHGGLTPEETIVPVAVYLPVTAIPRPLVVRLIEPKKVIAGTRPELVFEITNLNNAPVEQIVLDISDPNINAPTFMVDTLQKLQRGKISLKVSCPSTVDTMVNKLKVRLTFQFNGQEHEQVSEVPIVYDSLFKMKFDLDDI